LEDRIEDNREYSDVISMRTDLAIFQEYIDSNVQKSFEEEISRRIAFSVAYIEKQGLFARVKELKKDKIQLDFDDLICALRNSERDILMFLKLDTDDAKTFDGILRLKKSLPLLEIFRESTCLSPFFEREAIAFRRATKKNVSLASLLSTKTNLFVCGEAGAGKSTTLLAYAEQMNKAGETVLYFTLNDLAEYMGESVSDETLTQGILAKINAEGFKIDGDRLKDEFTNGSCRLLLDGLDEAIEKRPFLADCIRLFAAEYNQVQIVVTSREIGEKSAHLCFLPLFLKRFTRKQLGRFIRAYLKDRKKPEDIAGIRQHLRDEIELDRVVRTPLLATVLCEVACVRNDLPHTEVKLYQDRVRLLSGDLDRLKMTTSRTSIGFEDIEAICAKIAFDLHRNGDRKKRKEEIVSLVLAECGFIAEDFRLRSMIDELIYPCELVVRMDENCCFGFGHLRFQEYFVACEMKSWSMDRFSKLIDQSWWLASIRLWALLKGDVSEFFLRYPYSVNRASVNKLQLEILSSLPAVARDHVLLELRRSQIITDPERLHARILSDLSKFEDEKRKSL